MKDKKELKSAKPFDLGIFISEQNFSRNWDVERLSEESDLSCEFIESLLYDKIKVPTEYATNFAKAFGHSIELWQELIEKHNEGIE